METNEVSLHQVRIYLYVKTAPGWVTTNDIAEHAAVAARTARCHAKKLTELGIFDVAELFPAHRYRCSEKAGKRNTAYLQRLTQAVSIFGLAET